MSTDSDKFRLSSHFSQGSRSNSLQQRTYEIIKWRIITLAFRPGEYLSESAVSLQLGLSKTPVRQALNRLMHEGMVQIIPRKGVIVNPISLHEVQELTQVRALNEGLCAALAADRATEEDIAEMGSILERAGPLIEQRDREQLMVLDHEFHQAIARAARNRILADLLTGLHERALRFWFIALGEQKQLHRIQFEHKAVFEAIAAHDSEAAADAIRAHIESFQRAIATTAIR